MRQLIGVIALLSLAGCSGRVPALGETSDGEKFTGTFDRRADGLGGAITLSSDKGVSCEGRWHLDDDQTGSAVMTCSDGRTGTAELSVLQASGTMRGMLGGKPFKGTFVDPVRTSAS